MSFKHVTRLINSRHDEVKLVNSTRVCSLVVMDDNAIGCKTSKGMGLAKHLELLATMLLSNVIRVLVRTSHPTKRHDTTRK